MDLVGELDAGGRGSNDEHAALGQLVRIAIVESGEGLERRWQRVTQRRDVRQVARPAGKHQHAAAQRALIGLDLVPLVSRSDLAHGGVRAHGRGGGLRESVYKPDHVGR